MQLFKRNKKSNNNQIEQEKKPLKLVIKENIITLVFALIIAGSIRSLVFEPFHIPSGSMKDGLLEGDFIISSKSSYGYSRYSFPFAMFPFKGRIFAKNNPKRGDVVIFRLPSNPRINYIKRLIGLPGDRIRIDNGKIILNGRELKQKTNGTFIDDNGAIFKKYIETNHQNIKYNILDHKEYATGDFTQTYKVPEDHYFFMGDNRDNSLDSRFPQVSFVHQDFVIGKAKFIFLSMNDSIFKFYKWPVSIRFNRIFDSIN
jgi:signal peptidase I